MRLIIIFGVILALGLMSVQADMKPGEQVPNPTLTSLDGEKIPLHDLLDKVNIIHLWKGD